MGYDWAKEVYHNVLKNKKTISILDIWPNIVAIVMNGKYGRQMTHIEYKLINDNVFKGTVSGAEARCRFY